MIFVRKSSHWQKCINRASHSDWKWLKLSANYVSFPFSDFLWTFKLCEFVIFFPYLKAAKTWSTGQCDITDIGWRSTGYRLINDQRPILQICTSRLFHLPEILQRLHHINCKRIENAMNLLRWGSCWKSNIILCLMRIIIVYKPSIMARRKIQNKIDLWWSWGMTRWCDSFYGQWIASLENHSYHFIP